MSNDRLPQRTRFPIGHCDEIRVLIVDDHSVVRLGLCALLACEANTRVIGEAADGCEAVSLADELVPDVIIMDLLMPRMDGLEATREIARLVPSTKILVLSSYLDGEMVGKLLRAGAAGYLLKEAAANDLVDGIRQVFEGNLFLGPVTSERLHVGLPEVFLAKTQSSKSSRLTTREAEVLQRIAEGFPSKRIAYDLAISIKTVEKHRGKLMRKLHIHEVAGLTRYAVSKGIVSDTAPAFSEGSLAGTG